jgi:3-mercaptopyruvate sulfurtransferase SseA
MQGFKNVKNMGGGYLAWIDHGFPVHHHHHHHHPTTRASSTA